MVLSQSLYKVLSGWGAEVHVLAPAWSHAVLSRMPEVSASFETPATHGELKLGARRALARTLRREHYDRAIVLPASLKAALIPWFARIPIRTGWRGEMRYGLLNDMRLLGANPPSRIVDRYVGLAPPRGQKSPCDTPSPSLTIDEVNLRERVQALGLNLERPVVAMMPGAAFGPSKQWPPGHFAQVAERCVSEGFQVWLLGSQADHAVGDEIRSRAGEASGEVFNLCGRSSLVDTVDLLSLADKAVTNDSGLMHIAAAVGCPVVAMYGATAPDYTPPMITASKRMHHSLECSPCWNKTCRYGHYKCLTEVRPDEVYHELRELRRGA